MGAMGYVTGIPVFCDSGFVVLSPISRALAAQSNVSLAVMGTALSGGLYATHCLVPPTPGPIAMAGTLNADLGLTILVGLVISIPAVVVAVLYAKLVASKIDIPANSEYTLDELKEKYGFKLMIDGSCSPAVIEELSAMGADGFILGTSALFGKGRPYAEIIPELRGEKA